MLALLVLLVYLPTLGGWFLGDDFDILRLISRQNSLGDVLFMEYAGNWGPVSYSQFYLNFSMGAFNPLGYHLTNLFWLWLAVYATYSFVRTAWPEAPFAAWAAALLFATHPVHDEAVSYICARSHTIGAALAMVAMGLYAHSRLNEASTLKRGALVSVAALAAFIGALSKESALTIPGWIVAFEWFFARGTGPWLPAALRTLARSIPFFMAAAAVPLSRYLVVGGAPAKLTDAPGDATSLFMRAGADLPVYGLYGFLPIPFSWMDMAAIAPWRWLGWLIVVGMLIVGIVSFWRDASGSGRSPHILRIVGLGLAITAVTVLPTIVADLPFRRRYLLIVSLGMVLVAAAFLERLRQARPRVAGFVLLILVLLFGVGLMQRNAIYRGSGRVAKNLFDTVLASPDVNRLRNVCLLTIPRFYGGDNESGAYLLHYTDIKNGLRMFGMDDARVGYPMKTEYADDYSAQVTFVSATLLDVAVTYRAERAYAAALERDPLRDRRKGCATAAYMGGDPGARRLDYRVTLRRDFWEDESRALFSYSDGEFRRIRKP